MPRDASDTRERLLRAGARSFATSGVETASLQAIVRAAGQRNDSALHYHFGSRAGLLSAIVARHQGEVEEARGRALADLEQQQRLDDPVGLVAAIVLPLCDVLSTPDGRDYLRIAAQLTTRMRIDLDGVDPTGTAPLHLARIFSLLRQALSDLDEARLTHRLMTAANLVAVGLGERARRVDEAGDLVVDELIFRGELVAMVVGLVTAAPVHVK